MKKFPYNPYGTNSECDFVETRIITSNHNTDRIVRLNHAPFFPSLKVFIGESVAPLKLGLDYELTDHLVDLDTATDGGVYCGVQLLNPNCIGTMRFEGSTLGDTFTDNLTPTLDHLIKVLNTPLERDYDKIDGLPAMFPQAAHYRHWSDFVNKDFVSDAIGRLSGGLASKSGNMEASLNNLVELINKLKASIVALDVLGHQNALNPHGTNIDQINAHPTAQAAANAATVYGADFQTLAAHIRNENGLTHADIEKYIRRYVDSTVTGEFHFQKGAANIRSDQHPNGIFMEDDKFVLKSSSGIVMHADVDRSETEYNRLVSGDSILHVGSRNSDTAITYNGKTILTTKDVVNLQPTPAATQVARVYTESSTFTVSGEGTLASPFRANLILHTATTSKKGIARVKDTPGTETSGYIASPKALSDLEDALSLLVPKTRKVNGVAMGGAGFSLNKGHIGLDKADNTADMDKPMTTSLTNAVKGKAVNGHKHDFSTTGMDVATRTTYGIGHLYTSINQAADATIEGGLTPNALRAFMEDLHSLGPRYDNTMKANDLEFVSVEYGTFNADTPNILTTESGFDFILSKGGELSSGKLSGTVNLNKVPLHKDWQHRANDCDLAWEMAPAYSSNLHEIAHPTAKMVSYKSSGGTPHGATTFLKRRLMFKNNKITVHVTADDSDTTWIDGERMVNVGSIAGTIAPTKKYIHVYEKDILPGSHAIAISVVEGSSGTPSAGSYAVYDGDELIAVSSDLNTPFFYAGTDITIHNNHVEDNVFFVYGNLATKRIEAFCKPMSIDGISTEHVFVAVLVTDEHGHVKGVIDGKYKTETALDYGEFNELANHRKELAAHGGGTIGTVTGLENLEAREMATILTQDNMDFFMHGGHPLRATNADSFASLYYRDHDLQVETQKWQAGFHMQGASPLMWRDYNNILENRLFTFEGSAVLGGSNGVDIETTSMSFLRRTEDTKVGDDCSVVTLKIVVDEADRRYHRLEVWKGEIAYAYQGNLGETSLSNPMRTQLNVNWVAEEQGNYSIRGETDHFILRYRYVVRTNTLKVLMLHNGRYTLWRTVMPESLEYFMRSRSVAFSGVGPMAFGGCLDGFDIPISTIKKVNNVQTLMESYLGTDTVANMACYAAPFGTGGFAGTTDCDRYAIGEIIGINTDISLSSSHGYNGGSRFTEGDYVESCTYDMGLPAAVTGGGVMKAANPVLLHDETGGVGIRSFTYANSWWGTLRQYFEVKASRAYADWQLGLQLPHFNHVAIQVPDLHSDKPLVSNIRGSVVGVACGKFCAFFPRTSGFGYIASINAKRPEHINFYYNEVSSLDTTYQTLVARVTNKDYNAPVFCALVRNADNSCAVVDLRFTGEGEVGYTLKNRTLGVSGTPEENLWSWMEVLEEPDSNGNMPMLVFGTVGGRTVKLIKNNTTTLVEKLTEKPSGFTRPLILGMSVSVSSGKILFVSDGRLISYDYENKAWFEHQIPELYADSVNQTDGEIFMHHDGRIFYIHHGTLGGGNPHYGFFEIVSIDWTKHNGIVFEYLSGADSVKRKPFTGHSYLCNDGTFVSEVRTSCREISLPWDSRRSTNSADTTEPAIMEGGYSQHHHYNPWNINQAGWEKVIEIINS